MKNWKVEDLFPVCVKPDCSSFNTSHALPHQREVISNILSKDYNYVYWQGGVGSAKTRATAVICAAMAIMIPKSKGLLLRKYYELNNQTLWGFFLESIERAFELQILEGSFKKCLSVKKAGKHTCILLPNGSEYKAAETKNISLVMGPSYDVIAISDAMENDGIDGPKFGFLFKGEGTVGGLQSRLRGQASSFYKLPNNKYKDMRRFIIESNPPPNINELHSIFGKEPGEGFLPNTNIKYLHIQSNSIQNDHNPASYVDEIKSQHSDPNDIKRILEGKSVPYYGGKKVIPSFINEKHVHRVNSNPDLPLFVSIDVGYQHPGVIFSQIKRCSYEKEHYIRLSEISNLHEKTTEELGSFDSSPILGILQHLRDFYPTHFDYTHYTQIRDSLLKNSSLEDMNYDILENHFHNIFFCIDKSSNRVQSSSKNRETDRLILLKNYGIRAKFKTNILLNPSLNRVRESFKKDCICGIPEQIVNITCEMLIDGYSGGYKYPKRRDGTFGDEPVQDHMYEDVCDADRYGLENFFFLNREEIAQEEKKRKRSTNTWEWMEKV